MARTGLDEGEHAGGKKFVKVKVKGWTMLKLLHNPKDPDMF